jgi:hypothetical protein
VSDQWTELYAKIRPHYGPGIFCSEGMRRNDGVPDELSYSCSPDPPQEAEAAAFRAPSEHLKDWLAASERKDPDPECWVTFIRMIRHVFTHRELPTMMPWSIMVLL